MGRGIVLTNRKGTTIAKVNIVLVCIAFGAEIIASRIAIPCSSAAFVGVYGCVSERGYGEVEDESSEYEHDEET